MTFAAGWFSGSVDMTSPFSSPRFSCPAGREGVTNLDFQLNIGTEDTLAAEIADNGVAYVADPAMVQTGTATAVNTAPTASNFVIEKPPLCLVELAGPRFTGKINRDISCMIKVHFIEAKETWKGLSPKSKKHYWIAFTSKYEVPAEREQLLRCTFEFVAAERYKSVMFEARKDAMKKTKTNWIGDCSELHPEWMKDFMWDELVREWSKDIWQCKSLKGRRNRSTMKDSSVTKHCGGSMSRIEHKARMAKELRREPTHREVFNRTHKTQRGTGDYVDNKSKRVAAEYEAKLINKYGSELTAGQIILNEEAWTEAAGGHSKGRMYGLGHVGGSSTILTQYSDNQIEQMVAQRVEGIEMRMRASLAHSMTAEFEKYFSANLDRALLGTLMNN